MPEKFTAGQLIGKTSCKECGEEAHLKADRSGNPYRWCTSVVCNVQVFTRGNPDRIRRMLEDTELIREVAPAPGPVPVPVPENVAPEPVPIPVPKKRNSWFQPLIGGNDE